MGKRAVPAANAKSELPCDSPTKAAKLSLKTPPGCGAEIPSEALNVNGEHYGKVVHALEKIKQLKHGRKLLPLCEPLTIAEGGRIAPYVAHDFQVAIQNQQDYTCGATIFAASIHDMVSPGVPIMVSQVEKYMEHKCSDVRKLTPPTIVIGLDKEQDPTKCKGGLIRVTAPEPVHAFLCPFYVRESN